MSTSDIDALTSKLKILSEKLTELLETSSEELSIAKELQKLLHPNRLSHTPGIKCHCRYISAGLMSAEGFDIITPKSKDGKIGKESWFVASWTQSFGLSSLLLQTLLYFQTQALSGQTAQTPRNFFSKLLESLGAAKKEGEYRLLVAKFDHLSLKWSGISRGYAPLLVRERTPTGLSAWRWMSDLSDEESFEPGMSRTHMSETSVHEFSFSLPPGARLAFLSPAFAGSANFEDYEISLLKHKNLKSLVPQSHEIIDDLNDLLLVAEDKAKELKIKADITGVVWEVDSKRLHIV